MVQYLTARLDDSFAALSDATRRGVLEQLGRADASITDLAEKFHMTLTGMKKHVGVLEQAGLVTTEKVGRVRTCKLGLRRLEEEAAWIESYRQLKAPVVLFDAEPDRLLAAFQQVFPPHERTLAEGDRPADYIVDAAVADDGAGPELSGPELWHRVERERILAPAPRSRLLGTPQSHNEHRNGGNEQHRGEH